jgi:hypothetical protein
MFMNVAVTRAEFHADPERRLRAAMIRRAGEMRRASVALSGWLGTLARRALDGVGPPIEQARRDEVMRLAIRALAWATALRRHLLYDDRRARQAALLSPSVAAARRQRPDGQTGDGQAGDGPAGDGPAGDGQVRGEGAQALAVLRGLAPEVGAEGAPAVPARVPAVPATAGETAGVVFLTTAVLDARLRAAERRAVGAPPRIDPTKPRSAPGTVRDRRRCAEDEAAASAVARLTMAAAFEHICADLTAVAEHLKEKAAVKAVRGVVADLTARFDAYMAMLRAKASARAAEAAAAAAAAAAMPAAPATESRRVYSPQPDWQAPARHGAGSAAPRSRESHAPGAESRKSELPGFDSHGSESYESDSSGSESPRPRSPAPGSVRHFFSPRDSQRVSASQRELQRRAAFRLAMRGGGTIPDTG